MIHDKQRAEDRSKIDNDYELEYWMNKFGVGRDELEAAIRKWQLD